MEGIKGASYTQLWFKEYPHFGPTGMETTSGNEHKKSSAPRQMEAGCTGPSPTTAWPSPRKKTVVTTGHTGLSTSDETVSGADSHEFSRGPRN